MTMNSNRLNSIESIRNKQIKLKEISAGNLGAKGADFVYDEFLQTLNNASDLALVACVEPKLPLANLGHELGKMVVTRVPGAFFGSHVPYSAQAAFTEVSLIKGVADFVVMGHSGLGGCSAIGCCLKGSSHPDNAKMKNTLGYLGELNGARDQIVHSGLDESAQNLELVKKAVRISLNNLENDPAIVQARNEGKEIRLHGWILDLGKALSGKPEPFLYELVNNKHTDKDFILMADAPKWQSKLTGATDAQQDVQASLY